MATKIRLARHGKKSYAFYHIVVADSRAPRDGRFIEKLGTFNPNTNPATIELNIESTVKWLGNGAQPTDTAKNILSEQGAMLLHHLNGGIRKGALTQEQATAKFDKWIEEKAAKQLALKEAIKAQSNKSAAEKMKAETAAKDAKASVVAAKLAEAAKAAAAENAPEAAAEEVEETETPAQEVAETETVETPAE